MEYAERNIKRAGIAVGAGLGLFAAYKIASIVERVLAVLA